MKTRARTRFGLSRRNWTFVQLKIVQKQFLLFFDFVEKRFFSFVKWHAQKDIEWFDQDAVVIMHKGHIT
jgi:hypothetical protein